MNSKTSALLKNKNREQSTACVNSAGDTWKKKIIPTLKFDNITSFSSPNCIRLLEVLF